ncbi:TPA: hypothetical protein ACGOSV_001282 [Streptococcus suis]|nr:hypothetical protein [Streptococcus suis]NQK45037.1 hypothetical protein [Streptococcus suis]HEM5985262.1 hypothetical protein [Streptococcus suis]HEM6190991.1 hypothetical protein [Streptococcus suis]HEM6345973.1 hypothetical protein [Streptococcus suis]
MNSKEDKFRIKMTRSLKNAKVVDKLKLTKTNEMNGIEFLEGGVQMLNLKDDVLHDRMMSIIEVVKLKQSDPDTISELKKLGGSSEHLMGFAKVNLLRRHWTYWASLNILEMMTKSLT